MILILGGTTEGRLAVRVADAAGSPYWYSTRGDLQQIECKHGTHISGALDEAAMAAFCTAHGIRLLVNAAHPFAVELHRTVAAVAESLDLPVVRVERVYAEPAGMSGSDRASIRWCDDYADAIRQLEADGINRLLSLTGVQTIGKLRPFWNRHTCWFRILRREESLEKARQQEFPEDRLAYYEEEDDASLIARLQPDAILTKESGESGGFNEKVTAAHAAGIPVYVVRRPPLPAGFEIVTGEHGLRKAIERLAPEFFPLRSGFTTGACATAAAKAALLALLGHPVGDRVEITFPDGEILALPVTDVRLLPHPQAADSRAGLVERQVLSSPSALAGLEKVLPRVGWNQPLTDAATATVIKDAGDDPDVTNGYPVVATVAFCPEPGIHFLQGEGVGRVTLPGLGLPLGGPAINRVPRQMIERELAALYDDGLDVTISVPGGRELAKRTFNPKLGVMDGISIIGTSGIVRPFSNEAFVDAIRKEIEVAKAVGVRHLVINSGAKSEAFLKKRFPDLPPQAFVHYGNFIGETLRIAVALGVPQVTMGIMLGKAVKLAEGHLDTHSKSVVMNKTFLLEVAAGAGCSSAAAAAIDRLTLARELWHGLSGDDAVRFFSALLDRCAAACATVCPRPGPTNLTILLLDDDGNIFIDS
ncbi:MAG: cobalamin biosynthesis protein CbiD [Bacteroidales bacterium]|nr:cobalamin biosynthesis protein CbiD [Bacteroidales bacterium]